VLDDFVRDLRYALRSLRRLPLYSLAAAGMLTVGLGLAAGVYTVFNGLFFRGWPVAAVDRVFVPLLASRSSTGPDGFSLDLYSYLRQQAKAADYVAFTAENLQVKTARAAIPVVTKGVFVSANFAEVIGLPLQRGIAHVGSAEGTLTALVSDRVWKELFAGDARIIGRTMWVEETPVTIVGVLRRGVESLGATPVHVVLGFDSARVPPLRHVAPNALQNSGACCVTVAGRVREGWTRDAVREESQLLVQQHRVATGGKSAIVHLSTTTAGDELMRNEPGMAVGLVLIAAATLFVVILTWANVANLFLARALARRQEIATRLMLGARRGQIVRGLLTEGLVLASIAGVLAFVATGGIPNLLRRIEDEANSGMFAADWRVATFTSASVIVTCVLVTLAPALHVTRAAGPTVAATRLRANAGRRLILALQMTIAISLTIVAILLTRGTVHALAIPVEFALDTTSIGFVNSGSERQYDTAALRSVREGLIRRSTLSDASIGVTDMLPDGRMGFGPTQARAGDSGTVIVTQLVPLSGRGAEVLQLNVARGRWPSDAPGVFEAAVNNRLAHEMWPDDDALGRRLTLAYTNQTYTIVGIVSDARLTAFDRIDAILHIPPISINAGFPVLIGRVGTQFETDVKAWVSSLDKQLQVSVMPLREPREKTLREARVGAAIAGALAALTLTLAAFGVFTLFCYLLEERRRDLGIRVALGASAADIVAAIFRATRGAMLAGVVAGVLVGGATGTLMRSFLFGLSPLDPISYGTAAVVMLTAGVLAVAFPDRRAIATDPVSLLRAE